MVVHAAEAILFVTVEGVGHIVHGAINLIPVVGGPLAKVVGLILPG